jgi:organic hydroperoxide reductase OsmC/OhrA
LCKSDTPSPAPTSTSTGTTPPTATTSNNQYVELTAAAHSKCIISNILEGMNPMKAAANISINNSCPTARTNT